MNCNKIISDKNCNTVIQEEYDKNYVYVYVLQLNHTTGIISNTFIRTAEDEIPIFDIRYDGFYTLATLKVSKHYGQLYYKNDKFYYNF